jgi:hypothetical protein
VLDPEQIVDLAAPVSAFPRMLLVARQSVIITLAKAFDAKVVKLLIEVGAR